MVQVSTCFNNKTVRAKCPHAKTVSAQSVSKEFHNSRTIIRHFHSSLQLKKKRQIHLDIAQGLRYEGGWSSYCRFYLDLDLHFNKLISRQLARRLQSACVSGLLCVWMTQEGLAQRCAFQRSQSNPFLILRPPAGTLLLEKHHTEHVTLLIRGILCDSVQLGKNHFGLLAN